ncbi:MAG: hypothetical protein WDN75_01465 [Bacteroidota bacterium]
MNEKNDISQEWALKNARRTAIYVASVCTIAMIIVVYAFFNKEAADNARLGCEVQSEEYRKRAEIAEKELANQKVLLDKALKVSKEADRK